MNLNRTRLGGRASWCELTERGRAQATALGEHLKRQGRSYDAVYTSTAVRAQQTTRLMLDALGTLPWAAAPRPDIEEVFYGAWEGALREDVYTQEMLAQVELDPWGFRPPRGETMEEGAARLMSFLWEVTELEASRVAVVSHGMLIRGAIVMVEGLETQSAFRVEVTNTSVTTLRVPGPGEIEMQARARAEHLDRAGLGSLSGVLRPANTTPEEGR